jgi:hypothetical protein
MTITIRVELGPEALNALMRPLAGQGGFQSLLRFLQASVDPSGVLTLTPDAVERIARYVHSYGRGGFQGRLDALLSELTKLARALEQMAA